MSLLQANSRNDYIGNNATATYAFTFRIQSASHLKVIKLDLVNNETILVLNTDFTVSGVGSASGGTITLTAGNLPSNYKLAILRVVGLTQETDIRNQGAFYPEIHEDVFDRLTAIDQQQQDAIDRSLRLPASLNPGSFDMELPANVVANPDATIVVNSSGNGLAVGPSATAIAGAATYASAAATSASDSSASALLAQDWAIKTSGTVNGTDYSAKQHALDAATSAASAAASAAAGPWKDVIYITFANSPYAITNSTNGKFIVCDTTGGSIVVTLPQISTLTLTNGWSCGIKKSDSSANSVTINANAADVVEGSSSFVLSKQNFGVTLLPDIDPSPDAWTAIFFGDVRNLYSPTIYTPTIDISTITGQASTPANPSAGSYKTYIKTSDSKMYMLNSSGVETAIGTGSGAGGINYISNADAESATTGWATYADAAGLIPVDGTGGAANITFTRSASSQLRGLASFHLTKDAVNRQGQGFSYDFAIDRADRYSVLRGSFEYEIASGTYTDDALEVFIFDVTNSAIIYCTPSKLKTSTLVEKYSFEFQTGSSQSYRFIVHFASANASAFTMRLDNFSLGPQPKLYGSFASDSVVGTCSFTGTTTNPTKGTISVDKYAWSRIADKVLIQADLVTAAAGSAGSGQYLLDLPAGLSFDSAKTFFDSTNGQTIGEISLSNAADGVANISHIGVAYAYSANKIGFKLLSQASASNTYAKWADASGANFASSNLRFSANITAHILGWGASQILSTDADSRVVAAMATGTPASAATNAALIYTSLVYDTHNAYSVATGKFTCPVTGYYRCTVRIRIGVGQVIQIYKNNVAYAGGGGIGRTNPTYGDVNGTVLVYCVVGDTLHFGDADAASGAALEPGFVQFEKIIGPAQVMASEVVCEIATGTPQASYTANTAIIWPTLTKSTHNSYNVSTGEVTIVASGYYQVFGAVSTNVAGSTDFYAALDGTRQSPVLGFANSSGLGQFSGVIFCIAGQKLTVRASAAWTTSSGTNSMNGLSVVKV